MAKLKVRKMSMPMLLLAMLFLNLSSPFVEAPMATATTANLPKVFQNGYIDPELLNSTGLTRVLVIARDGFSPNEIANHMKSYRVTPSIGGFNLIIGVMRAENAKKLAENQHILAVLRDRMVEYDTPTKLPRISSKMDISSLRMFFKPKFEPENGMPESKPETNLRDVVNITGAKKTWATYNITGANTTIAIIDTGVDYGAFSLAYWDTVARDNMRYPTAFDADALGMAIANMTVTAFENATGIFIPTNGTSPYIYIPYPIAWWPTVINFTDLFGFPWFSDMNVTGILSKGQEAHFGIMFQWLYWWDLFPVLVVKSTATGAFDTVYVDLSFDWAWLPFLYQLQYDESWPYWTAPWPPDFSFADEKSLTPTGRTVAARDFTGDGIYDLSAGSLGYLLDVWSVAPNKFDKGLVLKPVDPYGNYTVFVNDWWGHGTLCASSAAGRDIGHPSTGAGVAPNSKIMGIVALWIGDIIEAELWAAGFDLIPGTEEWYDIPGYGWVWGTWNYTGNHKADIISNSWGYSDWASSLQGLPWYDVLTILEDALTVPGYLDPKYPGTVIVHAGGNGAAGYGTFTEPAYGALPIGVGASTAFRTGVVQQPRGYYDDVISWSARGPSPMGYVKPDVVNVGAWASVASPIWMGFGNGSDAWDYFGGTSMATPLTAGASALVAQSYESVRGQKPMAETTKIILKSTAQDLGYDAFVQGAGRDDCFAAASLALEVQPNPTVEVSSPAPWNNIRPKILSPWLFSYYLFGSPLNETPPTAPIRDNSWFAGDIRLGESASAVFTLRNPDKNSTVKASITAVSHKQVGTTLTYSRTTGSLTGWFYERYGDLFIVNKTLIPSGIDLMTFTVTFPYKYFDVDNDYAWDRQLSIYILDWIDANSNEIVEPTEVYLLNYGYNQGTSSEARVGFPLSKFTGQPVVWIRQQAWTSALMTPVPYKVFVGFWARKTWDWVTTPASIEVSPASSTTFTGTLTVPSNASQGTYEGQIILNITNPYARTIAIPVSVNVPAVIPTNALTYDITPPSTTELYDPYSFRGFFDWSWRYESGDWKTWLIDIQDPSVVAAFVSCNWTSEMTDIDMVVINPAGVIMAGSLSPYFGYGTFEWRTRTGAKSEWVASHTSYMGSPVPGVYTILLHNVLLNGTVYPENVTGRVELVKLTPRGPEALPAKPGESASFTFTLSTGRTLKDISIVAYPYTQFLASMTPSTIPKILSMESESFNVTVTVPKETPEGVYPILVEVAIPGLTGDPMYMSVVVFINVVAESTPPMVNTIWPTEGKVLGETLKIEVYAKDELDKVKSVEYSVTGETFASMTFNDTTGLWTASVNTTKLADGVYTLAVNATDRAGNSAIKKLTFTVDNTKPTAGITVLSYLRGTANITLKGEDPNFDRMELYISGQLAGTWIRSEGQTYSWNTSKLTDGPYTVKIVVYDKAENIATNETTVMIDNTSPIGEVRTPSEGSHLKGTYDLTIYGYDTNLEKMDLYVDNTTVKTWTIGGVQIHTLGTTAIADGPHTIKLVITDKAGNSIEKTTAVTVDNTKPSVSITSPKDKAELSGSVTIAFTASDANMKSIQLIIDASVYNMTGETSFTWDTTKLGDGSYVIKLIAYDKAGNMNETSITVNTINTRLAIEAARNMYLAIGTPIGLIIGIVIAWAILKHKKAPAMPPPPK